MNEAERIELEETPSLASFVNHPTVQCVLARTVLEMKASFSRLSPVLFDLVKAHPADIPKRVNENRN